MDQSSAEKDSRGSRTVAERVGMIKNPLTIIAIFAGIAELSGTIVLPLLKDNVQLIFVWFVMFFPVLLVILFFAVLLFKNDVLYAPSDYTDEGNFVMLQRRNISPANPKEIREKLISQFETDEDAEQIHTYESKEKTSPENHNTVLDSPIEPTEILRKDSITSGDSGFVSRKKAIESIRTNNSIIEKMILSKIRFEQNVEVEDEASLMFENGKKLIFDGAYYQNDKLTVIEIKKYNQANWLSTIRNFLMKVLAFSENKTTNLEIRIILFSDEKVTGRPNFEILEREFSFSNVPVTFDYINLDELVS